MLTIKQPAHYGYRSVHDLPTPPSSTYRLSPPVVYQETGHRTNPTPPRTSTPSAVQQMSSSHRPLPPPAAMTLAQHPSQAPGGHPQPPGPPPLSQPPLQQSIPPNQHGTHLPPPPQWHQGSGEDSMRAWLAAKAEEEKRKQEEERTRQESLRLEQRKMEHEILRTSLSGGIPPSMVPVVFAGMGGSTLTQAALEMAHHVMQSQMSQAGQPQLLPPAGPASPEHRRDQQSHSYGQYSGTAPMPGTPGSAHATHSGFVSSAAYPGSPTRSRGYSGPPRPLGAGLPNLNTNVAQGPSGPPSQAHPSAPSAQPQEAQPSPSIYFHHWQPPSSQGGGSGSQSVTPSVSESPRKRKATGPQQPAPPPSNQQRPRSPPFGHPGSSTTLANPPPGRRRGHARQRSDVSSYRLGGARPRSEIWTSSHRAMSPIQFAGPSTVARGSEEPPSRQQTHQPRAGAHSVSSLLSEQPSPHLIPRASSSTDVRPRRSESEPGNSPGRMLEDKAQGGAGGSTRERDDR